MCLAPQQRLGLAEGGPSTVHPSWSQASSQMFLAFGELRWGQGRPAAGQGGSHPDVKPLPPSFWHLGSSDIHFAVDL